VRLPRRTAVCFYLALRVAGPAMPSARAFFSTASGPDDGARRTWHLERFASHCP
jgi:hypothetical protein